MKRVLFCVLVLLLCFSVACGNAVEPSALPSPEPTVTVEPLLSPEPSEEPSAEPSPEPSPTTESMSYEEYFSEERKLESTYYESPLFNDRWEEGMITRRSDGKVLAERPEYWCVIVGENGGYSELLIQDDKRIWVTENCGENRVLVYEAEGTLRRIYSPDDSTLFAFTDGTKRYRLYVPTRTVDFLFDLPNVMGEEDFYELANYGKIPSDELHVWAEELFTNYQWWVKVSSQSDEWMEASAKAQGTTVDELLATDGASWGANITYHSNTGECEIDEGHEFVWNFVELS